MKPAPEISVVLPLFNESGNIAALYRRLTASLESTREPYDILFVDDGSWDDSFDLLRRLHRKDPRHVSVLRLSRNFGQHAALTAGMDHARGNYVAIMDGDLQDRPEDIPKLYLKIREGYDCVFGVRVNRRHGTFKIMASRLFNRLVHRAIRPRFPIETSILRIMNRPFLRHFLSLRERHRCVTILTAWMGFRQIGVPVLHGRRFSGGTKYSLAKMAGLGWDVLTAFSLMPLRMAFVFGAVAAGAALAGLAGFPIAGGSYLWTMVLLFQGCQFLLLGVIGEYVGRSLAEQKNRPLYLIQQRLQRRVLTWKRYW